MTSTQPIMPTYQGLVSEEGLLQLIVYIQSLKASGGEAPPAPTTQAGSATKDKAREVRGQ